MLLSRLLELACFDHRCGIEAKAELGHALQRKRVTQQPAKEAGSTRECGLDFRGTLPLFLRDRARPRKPHTRSRAVRRKLDEADARALEARVGPFTIDDGVQFFAKQLFEPRATNARVTPRALSRTSMLAHVWVLKLREAR